MTSSQRSFVILANSSWGFIHQREHELAKEFALLGYSVYYIEEMPSVASVCRRLLFPAAYKKLRNALPEGITVLTPPMCLTFFRSSLVPLIDAYQLKRWLKKIIKQYRLDQCVLLYSFSYWFYLNVSPRRFNATYTIFDYSDDESVYARNAKAVRRLKEGAALGAGIADLVLYTSQAMDKRDPVQNARHKILLPNAVSREFFIGSKRSPAPKDGKLTIGYVGVLLPTVIDAELLKKIEDNERWRLRLAGSVHRDLARVLTKSEFTGLLNRQQVVSFIDQCDVCIVPFTRNDTTSVVDPLKMYEYFARGKPVVAIKTRALAPYEDVIYLSASHEEFLQNIEKALHEDSLEKQEQRVEFARRNTWTNRVEQLMNCIQ